MLKKNNDFSILIDLELYTPSFKLLKNQIFQHYKINKKSLWFRKI